ncbi:hypothetical protein TrVE_jg12563 [Triparma verrucosa]|uniref:Uncharacterized protein n=1 Tax=Triparma verrucosa TaxID=1606542 RepID=A0A9W7B5T4_9STRA|nr:hypothetical protein TrVE_jg12563 [Triparma verrucosa]
MSGNGSVILSQLAPGSNVVSSPGGGGAVDILNNVVVSGVVYQKLVFGTDDANATPMTVYENESVATDITEGGLDDHSVIVAGRTAASLMGANTRQSEQATSKNTNNSFMILMFVGSLVI